MILVKTEIKPSELHGIGIFAMCDIVAGTLVWKFNPIMDRLIHPNEIEGLPEHTIQHIHDHSYIDINGDYVSSLDHNHYSNHSYEPNLDWNDNEHAFCANRDIAAGEELTKNYSTFYDYDISNIRNNKGKQEK